MHFKYSLLTSIKKLIINILIGYIYIYTQASIISLLSARSSAKAPRGALYDDCPADSSWMNDDHSCWWPSLVRGLNGTIMPKRQEVCLNGTRCAKPPPSQSTDPKMNTYI